MEFETSVVVLSHSNYLVTDAGVEKVIQGQQKLFLENRINFIVVYPIRKNVKFIDGIHKVTTNRYGLIVNGQFKELIDNKKLQKFFEELSPKAVIIHELVTFRKNRKLFNLFNQITCPIYYYVHDYAMVCYSHTLMRNNREFCGMEPVSWKKCKNCRYYLQGKKNAAWQQKFVKRYPDITYIFPSTVVRDIWKKTHQVENRLLVIPNTKFSDERQKYIDKRNNEKIRIAFVGYGRVEKGWNTWKKVCEKFDKTYDLYILGDGICDRKVTQILVSVSKDGPNAMIDTIRKNNIDIAFLWSTRPETYSYTFFESFVNGCYIITNHLSGNICYMTSKYQCGQVFDSEEHLFAFLDNPEGVRASIEAMYRSRIEHPLSIENNDEILNLIRGEQ